MHPFSQLSVPPNALGIWWFGQSSFAFKAAGGPLVQVDPYFPRQRPVEKYIYAEPPLDEATLPTDIVLLTHNHSDHTCIESLLRIEQAFPAVRYVAPVESAASLTAAGVPTERVTTINAGQSAAFDGLVAHAVWAKPPRGAPDDGIAPPDVEHLGYVADIGGVRVYVSGDPINTFANHPDLVQPVAALRPHLGCLTTHPTEGEFPFFEGSAKLASLLGLQAAIPSHYGCFVRRTFDPQAWAAHLPADGPRPLIIPYNTHAIFTPQAL